MNRQTSRMLPVLVVALLTVVAYAEDPPKLKTTTFPGLSEQRPGDYLIGKDLHMAAEPIPARQVRSPRFFKEIVTAKYEEKKRELSETTLTADRLEEKEWIEGLTGCGFFLVGEFKEGRVMVECHWLQIGDRYARVMLMGNAVTYEANRDSIHALMKSLAFE